MKKIGKFYVSKNKVVNEYYLHYLCVSLPKRGWFSNIMFDSKFI